MGSNVYERKNSEEKQIWKKETYRSKQTTTYRSIYEKKGGAKL